MFRRNAENNDAGRHANDHEHSHDHNEINEALRLAETVRGRRKLLVAGIANGAIMSAAGYTTLKSGAGPTAIETIHDLGDMGYYLAPWFATMKTRIHSLEAIRWMKRTAYAAAGLAATSMSMSIYEAAANGAEHPGAFSAPAQVGFAVANGAIAMYVGHNAGSSTIDKAAVRHAKTDARTSVVAGICNAAALFSAPFNPLGSVLVGGMTIANERKTINEANEALTNPGDQPEDTSGALTQKDAQ